MPRMGSFGSMSERSPEKRRRVSRDAGDLVRGLAIELEVELGLGSPVLPIGKLLELPPPETPLRPRSASDRDAHARCLPSDPALLRDRFGRGHDAAGDETPPPFVLAREYEDRVVFGDALP